MNINGILHFTIDPDGVLSLWDSAQKAAAGKEADDVQVTITLTKQQMVPLLRAETLAKQKRRDRMGRPADVTTTGEQYQDYLKSIGDPRD